MPRIPPDQCSPYGVAAGDSAPLTSTALPRRQSDRSGGRQSDRGSGDDPPANRRRLVRYWQLDPEYGIGWSRMHCDRMSKLGKFPQKVHIGPNTVGYWSDELESFLAARDAERGEAAA